MKDTPRDLPLSMVTLVFGVLSVPLAPARQLCAPAAIMGVLAVAFHLWGRARQKRRAFSPASIKRSRLGFITGIAGAISAVFFWVLGLV